LFIENRWQWLMLAPILPGVVVAAFAHCLGPSGSISLWFSSVFSLFIAAGTLFLLFGFPRWRLYSAALALLVYSLFSWVAYRLYWL
jgi:hypothetical protein